MGICRMAKFMIVSHRSEAAELLEALQREGICQILNAEEAMVSKDWPELGTAAQRPRDIEEFIAKLAKSIAFLEPYTEKSGGLGAVLSPRTVIDEKSYDKTVADKQLPQIVEQLCRIQQKIETLKNECENLYGVLEKLEPWAKLEVPVEDLEQLEKAKCLAGLIPSQHLEHATERLNEIGAVLETVGPAGVNRACLIVCLNENVHEVQRLLRSFDFEAANFESMTGTVAEIISKYSRELNERNDLLQTQHHQAGELSENLLKLQILYDHYSNLLNREQTRGRAPATEQTVILEGWTKKRNYTRLEKIVSGFAASSISEIAPAEDEQMPVEIENSNVVRPFEVITRLYGMPKHFEVDPTSFLAPFFALFFALCLTDAGYGLVIIALAIFFIRKMQGDKKLMWLLGACSVVTVVAGALTGGWFGDAVQQFIPALGPVREKLMWFDPLEKPMIFFYLSLALGYIQILTGLAIAFFHNLRQKEFTAAVCDQLTWLVMLNSIVIFGAGKAGVVSADIGRAFGFIALVPAGMIFFFSERQGGWAGRLGMGAYNLFSAIFYMGDVLSYLRLMALGMVTAGLAMAINVIAKITLDIPYIGFLVMIIVLVGGHAFNLAISTLSAFVHTLRLQYVEFFPKFLVGGGRSFEPLSKKYKHIYIKQ